MKPALVSKIIRNRGDLGLKNLIVIPAYNEEEALPKTLANLQAVGPDFEVLVVNDGSKDRTALVAEEIARSSAIPVHVVHLPVNSGIGVAVQTGYLFARKTQAYKYVIQFDADGQHEASYLPALVKACEDNQLDLCVGSRFLEANEGDLSTPMRRVGIRFFCTLIHFLAGVKVTDPTSGYRCAGPRAWSRFARVYPEDYPEPESLFWCARNGLKVGEIPVHMHARQGGVSSIRFLGPAYYMLKVSLAIFFDRLRSMENQP